MIITTTDSLDGYVIEEYKGLVESGKCFWDSDAHSKIQKFAKSMGANAIVGFRMISCADTSEGNFYCYGTAVVLKKIKQ